MLLEREARGGFDRVGRGLAVGGVRRGVEDAEPVEERCDLGGQVRCERAGGDQ